MIREIETLRARLAIRDFFLQTTVKEIYENTGQVLSAIKLKLEALEIEYNHPITAKFNDPGMLLGQSVRDLRRMSKCFFPDEDLLKTDGLVTTLQQTITLLQFPVTVMAQNNFVENDIAPDIKLLTFKILLDILLSIQQSQGKLQQLSITRKLESSIYDIKYKSKKQPGNHTSLDMKSIFSRETPAFASSISYRTRTGNGGTCIINLQVPN